MTDTLAQMAEEYAALVNYIDDEEIKLKPYKDAAANLKDAIKTAMAQNGIKSTKTSEGHAFGVAISKSFRVVDADAFFDFVFAQGDSDFVERRASKDRCDRYLQETNQLPPGVECTQVETLRFTRAKA